MTINKYAIKQWHKSLQSQRCMNTFHAQTEQFEFVCITLNEGKHGWHRVPVVPYGMPVVPYVMPVAPYGIGAVSYGMPMD